MKKITRVFNRMVRRAFSLERWVGWLDGTWTPDDTSSPLTMTSAMQIATVHACVRVISETAATCLPDVMQSLDGGGKRIAKEAVEYTLLKHEPNPYADAVTFWEAFFVCANLVGNGYAWIQRQQRGPGAGRPIAMWNLHPDQVELKRKNGALYYVVQPLDVNDVVEKKMILFPEDMLHLPILSKDGMTGMSPIAYNKESFRTSWEQSKWQRAFFKQGVTPRAVLETEEDWDEEDVKENEKIINNATSGEKSHGAIILPFGLKWRTISMKAEDVAIMDQYNLTERQICGSYRVPLPLIQNHEHSTYTNAEQLDRAFGKHCIRPLGKRTSSRVNKHVFTPSQREQGFYCKWNLDDLLEADLDMRYAAHKTGIESGFLTRNEARAYEDLSPIDGLDEIIVPLNMGVNGQTQDKNSAKRAEEAPIKSRESGQNEPIDVEIVLDTMEKRMKATLSGVFVDTYQRMLAREGAEIVKHAKKSSAKEFEAWFEKFLERHQEYYRANIGPVVARIAEGFDVEAPDIDAEAKGHCLQLRSEISTMLANSGGIWPNFVDRLEAHYTRSSQTVVLLADKKAEMIKGGFDYAKRA